MKIFWFLQSADHHPDNRALADQLRGSRLIIWITFITVSVGMSWAYFAQLDQITRAPGAVIASSRTQLIQSQDGGKLEALLVKEGDVVVANQVLARFERTRVESSYLESRAKMAGLSATLARLRAEVFGGVPKYAAELRSFPDFVENQNQLLSKRRTALKEDMDALESMKALARQELDMNRPLVKSGDVSLTEVLRLERQVADFQSQMTNKRNKYFQDAQAELNKAEEDLAAASQLMVQRKDQLDVTEMRSPMRGIVKNVRITTQGGVIRPGEEVMQIVPLEDDLVIEAKVSPADIGFLRLGMEANIKIDAYDYTIYGSLPGKLTFIGADTISENLRQNEQPYYRVHIRTTLKQFSNLPADAKLEIQPGMTSTIEVKTGRKSVLQYMTKPLVKTLNESMGER